MKSLKKFGVLALCAVMAVLFAGCGVTIGAGPNRQDLSSMIRTVYSKVVSIETSENTAGSGVIIYSYQDTGYVIIATNMHVITKPVIGGGRAFFDTIDVINWSEGLLRGEYDTRRNQNPHPLAVYTTPKIKIANAGVPDDNVVLYADWEQDLAIIKFKINHANSAAFVNQAVTLREDSPRVGEPIAAMGYSFGEFHRTSVGVVTQLFSTRTFPDGVRPSHVFMHDATTIFGNSGGPVFDASGKVVGLTTMIVMMRCSECKPNERCCDTPALGYSIAISSRHIASIVNEHAGCWGLTGSTHDPDCKLCP